MKKLPFIQTSVFVDDRYQFSGNQLAIFWNEEANKQLSNEEMQGIALEMNFSETTYIFSSKIDKCSVKVRIFTPGKELAFAGHPTLGTTYVLKEQNLVPVKTTKTFLELGIGPIEVEFIDKETISMFQPRPSFLDEYSDGQAIAEILYIEESDISDEYPIQAVSTGFPFLIVPLNSMDVIKSINLNAQKQIDILSKFITSELLVFTKETTHEDSDVHVRMFAPSAGVLEDPATGSAAGPLGSYLEHWNVLDDHEKSTTIKVEQGFEINRPSKILVQPLYTKDEITQVKVSGKVRKIAESTFFL